MVFLVLILTINFPVSNLHHQKTKINYENWMSETLSLGTLVKDVAMLGAHDAFTSDISIFSKVDIASASSIQTGFTGALIKGFSVKQSKTQVSSVEDLLNAGVRYFDIRLTYNEKAQAWYTSHTYFSTPIIPILENIKSFLETHPGEFIFLDIQHVNGIAYDDAPKFQEIYQLFEDAGIIEYTYLEGINSLEDITYEDITSSKTKAGVMIFSKFEENEPSFWSYGKNIRSAWPNTDQQEVAFDFLQSESDFIEQGLALTGNQMSENLEAQNSLNALRVMQAVLTMQMSGEGITEALLSWSLIEKAKEFNTSLIIHPAFLTWLVNMPIVMVDYSNTNYKTFNDDLMEIIVLFNQNL